MAKKNPTSRTRQVTRAASTQASPASRAGLTQEIASIDRDVTIMTFGGVLENLDDTLKSRGRGKGLKIYDDIERDAHAYAVLEKRKNAVVAREWDVVAASESAPDTEAAELVRRQVQAINFDATTKNLLDAILKGFAVGEVMWEVRDNLLVVKEIIQRDQRRFVFAPDRSLRLLTPQRLRDGEAVPDRKFIVHRFGAKDGTPYGLGLGHKLFWPVFFKRQDITFWLTFADKFGSPTAVGKYPNGTTEKEQKKLLAMLKSIANDAGVVVPAGMEVELLEAARSGSIDTYEKLARYMDEQISECVLGETMTTTAQAAGLGSNQASVHNEVRKEIAKGDADLLSETLNNTLVKWIVELNMPGAGLPKVWRNFEEDEDLNTRAARDKSIYDMGFRPTPEYITETYGEGWVEREIQSPDPLQPGRAFGPQFAETPSAQARDNRAAQDALADAAENLSKKWQTLIGRRVEDLVALFEETRDLATFRERLNDLLQTEPPKEVVEAIARAGFAAQLLGRAEKT